MPSSSGIQVNERSFNIVQFLSAPSFRSRSFYFCSKRKRCSCIRAGNYREHTGGACVQEYHIDGFRFDLASILTRAHSAWHPADWVSGMASAIPTKPGEEVCVLSLSKCGKADLNVQQRSESRYRGSLQNMAHSYAHTKHALTSREVNS
jgi:hypothetical protein